MEYCEETTPLDPGVEYCEDTTPLYPGVIFCEETTPLDPGVIFCEETTPLDPGVERRVKSAEQFLFKFRNNFYILSVFTMEAISILLQIKFK
jgi:hypothetical protein